MLKFINFQLDTEDKQKIIEQDLAPQIKQLLINNMQAMQQYQPHLSQLINQLQLSDHAIFCTKFGKLNLASMTTGRVVYQADPEIEVRTEVNDFIQSAPLTRLSTIADPDKVEPLPVSVDVVLVFGLGLGYHLIELLQNCRIKYLVIYEPQTDFFLGSFQTIDWRQVFEVAQFSGTQISLQIGNDASSVVEDLEELRQLLPSIDKVHLYRHICHPVSDEVFKFLLDNSGNPAELLKKGQHFLGFKDADDHLGSRPKNVLGTDIEISEQYDSGCFKRNMAVFERLYPKVFQVFKSYEPRKWRLYQDENGHQNLWHTARKAFLYDDLVSDSTRLLEHFFSEPFKDDIIIGLAPSEKFKSFVHYQYIDKLQGVFRQLKAEKSALPDEVESLIVFGVALAKHIEMLSEQKHIQNLYICEPNLDFFYASLYVTDWADLITKAENEQKRIYLNIGGDGSEYFHDLMGQFYQVGAYSIANTYLLQSYYTPQLSKAIFSLRRQLKVVLAIGEYYDHARFGFAHTYQAIESGCRFLKADMKGSLTQAAASEIPVFIVGNGPSLDVAAEYIAQYQDQAIIVSCGTALRSLYKLGIKPDFHAEIEQNRATFDWINQVNDKEYLKDINLISVNGIHPDTTKLFLNTYLAFKDGEASTQLFRQSLRENGVNVASLSYSYPTVSNLALNYMISLGFKNIYFFGVDLGYADIKQHHSRHSAYYSADGKEVYDYKAFHGAGAPVKGNFREFVFTKPEFDVSRQLLEKAISNAPKKVAFYNCSDGVLIKGANSLHPDYILLDRAVGAKKQQLNAYLSEGYYTNELVGLAEKTFAKLDLALFQSSVADWQELLKEDAESAEQAKHLIDIQWHFLKTQAGNRANLLFYLFYGSANYFLSVLTKCRPVNNDDVKNLELFNKTLQLWRDYLADALKDFITQPIKSDSVKVNYLPPSGN